MGVAMDVQLGRRHSGPLQRVAHQLVALLLGSPFPVDDERFLDRVSHAKAWIEGFVRVLVDELNLTTQGPHLSVRELGYVAPAEPNVTAFRVDHTCDSLSGGCLAASGLPH